MDFFGRKKPRPRQSSVSGRDSKTPTHKYRKSEASFSSGRRSPAASEAGHSTIPGSPSNSTLRGNHTSSSDYDRASRFSSATGHSDGNSGHLSQMFHKQHTDEFDFPRPDDAEIEILFSQVAEKRDLPNVDLTIEQKWKVVYAAEHVRWQEEKTREDKVRKQGETGGASPAGDGSPEWYIRKFMDGTISAKQVTSVWVSLRGHETRYDHVRRSSVQLTVTSAGLIVSSTGVVRQSWHKRWHESVVKEKRGSFSSSLLSSPGLIPPSLGLITTLPSSLKLQSVSR